MKEKPEQDADLFRQALEGVTPIKSQKRAPSGPAATLHPRPTAYSQPEISVALSDHLTFDETPTEYLANGVSRMVLRKLRRGTWPIEDSLDLHGLDSDTARSLLALFLQQATQRQFRCINLIHGKGWHSAQGEGKLKQLARHWLIQHPDVLAFCEAPSNAGGSGAVWVLLKSAS